MEMTFQQISLTVMPVLLTSDEDIISHLSFMLEKKHSPKEANKRTAKMMAGSPGFPYI